MNQSGTKNVSNAARVGKVSANTSAGKCRQSQRQYLCGQMSVPAGDFTKTNRLRHLRCNRPIFGRDNRNHAGKSSAPD